MLVERLDEFIFRAKELFVQSPDNVRYSIKYRNCHGRLVAKVTDDKVCLLYKTDQSVDLNKLEKLHDWWFGACTGVKRVRLGSEVDEVSNVALKGAKGPAKQEDKAAAATSTGGKNKTKSKRRKGKR
mmetsp:Transcript_20/g.69  ORF Transcript_20/g.69 Transcript_20/m.69 type:complete len:127 (-) Transcript_20:1417-1797(-)